MSGLVSEGVQFNTLRLPIRVQVHALEDQLSDTIGYLSGLERSAGTLQSSMLSGQSSANTAAQQLDADRIDSASTASTSEVRIVCGLCGESMFLSP